MKIGIFDSGLGGLSIFRAILTKLPAYDYIYFGDNARLPYGGRSKELIYTFTKNAVEFLFERNCQLIILACNAASANALRRLQHEYLPLNYSKRRILGVIRPVVEVAVEQKFRKIGILGTRATVMANSYPEEIRKLAPNIVVYQKACPLLVPFIEEDEMDGKELDLIIQKYLNPLLEKNIDGLILGCTHYGLIASRIKKHLPRHVQIISQSVATADKLTEYLVRHPEIETKLGKNSKRSYLATDLNQRYGKLTKLFLGKQFSKDAKLELINL